MKPIKLQETTKYRVETEEEAIALIEEFRRGPYEIKKSSYTRKDKKSKGEVIDSWLVVEITLKYNDEQMPLGE